MLVEIAEPRGSRVVVDRARAIRGRKAALGDEHRQPVLHGLFKFGAQVLPVGCRIEMAGVHDVFVLVQGVANDGHELAVVVGRSHDDDGVGVICPDDGDDLARIRADLGPRGLAVGFVADLVDDVGTLRVFGRDRIKELHSFIDVLVGVAVFEAVPVHERVHVGSRCRVDALGERLHGGGGVFGACLAVVVRIEGQADQVGVPLG